MAKNPGETILDRILKWMEPTGDEGIELEEDKVKKPGILDRFLDWMKLPDEDLEFDFEDEELFAEYLRRKNQQRRRQENKRQESRKTPAGAAGRKGAAVRHTKKIVQLDEGLPKKPARGSVPPKVKSMDRQGSASSEMQSTARQGCVPPKMPDIDKQRRGTVTKTDFSTGVREILASVLSATMEIVEGGTDALSASELEAIREEAYCYMRENPEDRDFLLFFSFIALDMYLYAPESGLHTQGKEIDKDLFDIKNLMGLIVSAGCEQEFFDYIKQEVEETCQGAYVGMTVTALRMIREIRTKRSAAEAEVKHVEA